MRMVYFPRTEWANRVIDQNVGFPAGKYDDATDCCALIRLALADTHPARLKTRKPKKKRDRWDVAFDELDAENYSWNGNKHFAVAREYLLRCIRFRLGATEIRAMETFFRTAAARGVIERAPRIRLATERRTGYNELADRSMSRG